MERSCGFQSSRPSGTLSNTLRLAATSRSNWSVKNFAISIVNLLCLAHGFDANRTRGALESRPKFTDFGRESARNDKSARRDDRLARKRSSGGFFPIAENPAAAWGRNEITSS